MGRVVAGIALAILVLAPGGCGRAPQIGTDREAFKTVDALYTAVGLRDADRVDQCGAKLKALHDQDKLPEGAYRALEAIIAEAKVGRWELALQRLSGFMEGQRR
jgi:hypothetical protein